MLDIFRYSFSTGRQQWRIAAIVYFFQLCLALTLGLQVLAVFESSIGNSLEINKLLHNYDHTVISDFLKIHGASITPLMGQLRWLIIIYLIFAIFIDAGLISVASKQTTGNAQAFWQGGANYFFPFLKIALIFLAFAALWTGIIFMPTLSYLMPSLEYFPNEKYTVWGVFALIILYLLGLSFLFLWSLSSRFWKIKNEASIFSSLKNGWQLFRTNKRKMGTLLALFFGLQVLLVVIYWTLEAFLGMTSPFLIIFMTLIQQAFAFSRVMIRQMFYTGVGMIIT